MEVKLPPGHSGHFMLLNKPIKEGGTMFGWMDQGKSGLPLHNEEYVCRIGGPQGHLSMLPCPVIKINGQLQPS